MFVLYVTLLIMMVASLGIIAVPYVLNKANFGRGFIWVSVLFTLFAMGLYYLSGDKHALSQWITKGKAHYQLVETFNQLGGIEGMIARIKLKLKASPEDAEGWLILGKLYLAKADRLEAKAAFSKAHELKPQDEQINNYYKLP